MIAANDRRMIMFQSVMKDMTSTDEYTDDDYQTMEEEGESKKNNGDYLSKIELKLFGYLKEKLNDKLRLLETLLQLLNGENHSLETSNCSLLFRCGCVVYTLFYQMMLDKNNIIRFGNHTSPETANSDASFRKNLQNHAMRETIDAIKILEEALTIVVRKDKCTVDTASVSDVVGNDILSNKVFKVLDADLAETVRDESRTLLAEKKQCSFSLLTKNGGIRRKSERNIPVAIKVAQILSCDSEDDHRTELQMENLSFSNAFAKFNGKDFFVRHSYPEGVLSPKEMYSRDKYFILELKHYLTTDLLTHVHVVLENRATKIRNSRQRAVKIRNNYRRDTSSDHFIADDNKRIAFTFNYLDSNILGKRHQSCDDQNEKELLQFSQVIGWILSLLQEVGNGLIVPNKVFPCASSGAPNSVNLIVALPMCSAQHFHYDYDHNRFGGVDHKGSSLFINFKNETTTIDVGVCEHDPNVRKQLQIPPMSVLVFRGDFKHAGSANLSLTEEIWKFFMYLDPNDNFRKHNNNILYYDQYDDLSYILWPEEIKQLLKNRM
jgi:hypothetical protein